MLNLNGTFKFKPENSYFNLETLSTLYLIYTKKSLNHYRDHEIKTSNIDSDSCTRDIINENSVFLIVQCEQSPNCPMSMPTLTLSDKEMS